MRIKEIGSGGLAKDRLIKKDVEQKQEVKMISGF